LNVKESNGWDSKKTLSYPNITYGGKANFAQGEQVVKEFMEYYEEVQ
jgi:hypothetical protein